MVASIVNFSPDAYPHYPVNLPKAGKWVQILNTDWTEFDGTGQVNNAEPINATAHSGDPESWAWANVAIPPMGAVWLRYSED